MPTLKSLVALASCVALSAACDNVTTREFSVPAADAVITDPQADAPQTEDTPAEPGDGALDPDALELDGTDTRGAAEDLGAEDIGALDAEDVHVEETLEADASALACADDMLAIDDFCMDRFEAPNIEGLMPLVMFTFDQAEDWCEARDKRLCFDDEWTRACEGEGSWSYPYGDTHESGRCNDEKVWRTYNSTHLANWPRGLASVDAEGMGPLFQAARDQGATEAANHLEWLYQAEPAGTYPDCTNEFGVRDTQGGVEEWTRRRDGGGEPGYSGNLKGRYWAEVRTCQSGVKSHADAFRFYEIGFRCCRDQ